MGIVWVIMIGIVLGVLVKLLSPGPNVMGAFAVTMLIGVTGALVGGLLGYTMADQAPVPMRGLLLPTVGAAVLLLIWNRVYVARRRDDE